jgi:WD40 repeat protein
VAVDAYAEPWRALHAGTSASTLAERLSEWGAAAPERACATTADGIRQFLDAWAKNDGAAASSFVYWAGHGYETGDRQWLCTSETSDQPSTANAIPAAELADYLKTRVWRRLARGEEEAWTVVVLDCCGSAVGVTNITNELTRDATQRPKRCVLLPVAEEGGSFEGRFVQKLGEVFDALTVNDQSISLQDLVKLVVQRLGGDVEPDGYIPASILLRRLEPGPPVTITLDALADLERVVADHPEPMRLHFFPKAKGADATDPAWYFSGRVPELRTAADWLGSETPGLLAVTGDAGSGKSALLGHLLTLSRPDVAEALRAAGVFDPAYDGIGVPPQAFDAALHLTGMTNGGVERELAVAFDVEPSALRERLKTLPKATILADALDEAVQPVAIARTLRTLTEIPCTRVVVGTRRGLDERVDRPRTDDDRLLRELAPAAMLVVERDPEGVLTYVERRLLAPASPYRERAQDVEAIARAVQQRDQPFLYARLVTGELLARPALPPGDPELEALLATDHRGVFARAVERLEGVNPAYRSLLEALAFARGRGLPRLLLPTVALSLRPDRPVTAASVDAFLLAAAPYITLDSDAEQSVYRLAHQTFAEHLRAVFEQPEHIDELIGTGLWQAVRDGGGWEAAGVYVTRHLPGFLAGDPAALEALCTDPAYLRRALEALGVDRLYALLAEAARASRSHGIDRIAAAVRRCRVALNRGPGELGAQLVARVAGVEQLAPLIDAIDRTWPGPWLRARVPTLGSDQDLRTAMRLPDKPRAIAVGELDGRAISAIAAGESVFLWDLRSGRREDLPEVGLRPTGVALGAVGGRTLIAAACGYDGVLRVFDLERREWTDAPIVPRAGQRMAITTVAGVPAIALADRDGFTLHDLATGAVLMHDDQPTLGLGHLAGALIRVVLRDGQLAFEPETTEYVLPADLDAADIGFTGIVALAAGEKPFVAVQLASDGGSVWNLATGGLLGHVTFETRVRDLAIAEVDGRPLAVAVNDTDDHWGFARSAEPTFERRRHPGHPVREVALVDGRLVGIAGPPHRPELLSVPEREILEWSDALGRTILYGEPGLEPFEMPSTADTVGEVTIERPEDWPETASAFGTLEGRHVLVRGSYGGVLLVFDALTGAVLHDGGAKLPHELWFGVKPSPDPTSDVAIGADLIATAHAGAVALYDARLNRLDTSWVTAIGVRAVAIGADGLVATGGDGGGLRVWDPERRERVASITLDTPVERLWLLPGLVVAETSDQVLHVFELRGV